MLINKLTPVLFVEAIEPSLSFWIDRLGFTKTIEVPDGDHLAFVAFQLGEIEVMLQTKASVAKDIPALAKSGGSTFLYLEVGDLDLVAQKLSGIEPVIPRRVTPYGMEELIVREPAGHVVAFAQRAAK